MADEEKEIKEPEKTNTSGDAVTAEQKETPEKPQPGQENGAPGNFQLPKEHPTREIQCVKCGAKFRIHEPFFVRTVTPVYTLLALMPSWSIEERRCPNCKTMHVCLCTETKFRWISAEPKDNEPKRIVQPGAPIPMTRGQLEKLQKMGMKR